MSYAYLCYYYAFCVYEAYYGLDFPLAPLR